MRYRVCLLVLGVPGVAAGQVAGPAFRDVISLESVGSPAISPDGKAVAYTVRTTDWEENRFDTEIWLWREGQGSIQLTRTSKGSSTTPRWSADGRWLGFLADRGEKSQLYLIGAGGGEAVRLTGFKDGVTDFRWSPTSSQVALLVQEPEADLQTRLKARYGEWATEDQEYRQSHLWVLDVHSDSWSPDTTLSPKPVRLTDGRTLTVASFGWSPDGSRIVFEHRRDPMINSGETADISIVTIATHAVTPLVVRVGSDGSPVWSPDGQWIAFITDGGDTVANFYRNNQLMKVPAGGGTPIRLAADFDEEIGTLAWTPRGIWFVAFQKTSRNAFLVNPDNGSFAPTSLGLAVVVAFDPSQDGRYLAMVGQETATSLNEVFRVDLMGNGHAERLTEMTSQIGSWGLGTSEVISWPSRDGTIVEGVLHKPRDFDPSKRYPLLVVIHGGPTGIDIPQPVPFYVYPIPEWVAKGAVVLRPNYRGSAGYGEKFRSLNVRNLGVGDMWDVMSGVDYLVKRGTADSTRMGAMGWSQGGYISAFLTTNTGRFRAISVGAGISNWVTYYVSTDIHPFTRQYLKATPWDDPAIYAKTSPMTTIKRAKTPTLIQHGQLDTRVPTQNAYELYQGLQDQGVPSELIIYKGFGHGITKPKEQLAAAWHNWVWFAKYLWGETVSLPVDEVPVEKPGGR